MQSATNGYEGYGTITLECVGSGKTEKVSVYMKGTDLGRSTCPWPEIMPGSPGYNPVFNFLSISEKNASEIQAQDSGSPSNETFIEPSFVTSTPTEAPGNENLQLAVDCMKAAKLAVVTTGPELIAESMVWNKLNASTALAVVSPTSTEQVGAAVKCMYKNDVLSVPRSGGHSYEGYSVLPTAITVDLGNMRAVTLNPDMTALVQGGARLGDIYYQVWNQSNGKQAAVGGTCPNVGAGGHILGGGVGFLVRSNGLACDQIRSMTMVDYKGDILNISPQQNGDLFWASCGGGGGNFGIVTEFVLQTVGVPPVVTSFEIRVRTSSIAPVSSICSSSIFFKTLSDIECKPIVDVSLHGTCRQRSSWLLGEHADKCSSSCGSLDQRSSNEHRRWSGKHSRLISWKPERVE